MKSIITKTRSAFAVCFTLAAVGCAQESQPQGDGPSYTDAELEEVSVPVEEQGTELVAKSFESYGEFNVGGGGSESAVILPQNCMATGAAAWVSNDNARRVSLHYRCVRSNNTWIDIEPKTKASDGTSGEGEVDCSVGGIDHVLTGIGAWVKDDNVKGIRITSQRYNPASGLLTGNPVVKFCGLDGAEKEIILSSELPADEAERSVIRGWGMWVNDSNVRGLTVFYGVLN